MRAPSLRFFCWLALLLAGGVRADPAMVYATLQPAQIHLGESAILTITNLGNGPADYTLPQVADVQFEVVTQQHQMELTGGVSLASTATIIRVTPKKAGVFSIPQPAKQDKLLVLEVLPNHGPAPAYSNSFNPAAPPPPKTPPSASAAKMAGIQMAADGAAFVRLQLPKRSVYVGESVPVDIEVGARAGYVTSLNGLPKLNGAEFTLDNLSHQPDRQELLIDGKPFVTLTWHSLIAAVKPGSYSLSVDTPLTVKFSTESHQDSALDNLLGDPFLHRVFGATVSREVTVTSPNAELTVLALPPGAPADFSGAVGSFAVRGELSAERSALGEPLTLRLHISGNGNFDRVDTPMLGSVPGWKSYPPSSAFKASDKVGHQGEKTFEQPVVAVQAGTQTLPALPFTYFDPVAQKYETAHSQPMAVMIAPNAAQAARGALPAQALAGLRPDHPANTRNSRSLTPLYLQPGYLVLPPLLGVAFLAGWVFRWRRDGHAVAVTSRASRSARAARALQGQLTRARRAGNVGEFLHLAQRAVRESLGRRWQLPPAAITRAELERRLGRDHEIAALFRQQEELRYAPGDTDIDYARWERLAVRCLERTQ